jgi:hypothetical protein
MITDSVCPASMTQALKAEIRSEEVGWTSARKIWDVPERPKAVAVAYPTPEGKAVPVMRTWVLERLRERRDM